MPEPLTDLYASEPQYLHHLTPIWAAFEREERGVAWLAGKAAVQGPRLEELGIVRTGRPKDRRNPRPVMVASYQDERACRPRPIIYVEHGAGQTYNGDPAVGSHPSYSGTSRHDGVVLFICPGEQVAASWRRHYRRVPAVAVGCPKLDPWLQKLQILVPAEGAGLEPAGPQDGDGPDSSRVPSPLGHPSSPKPTVAVSFHSDVRYLPETRWAFPHYERALPGLAEQFPLLGHGHPRSYARIEATYRAGGIEATGDFFEVLDRASVYLIDNSSTGFEFSALERPVIWMNAPWYRRDIDHGLRFWDVEKEGGGLMVDQPEELPDAIERALAGEGVLDPDFLDQVYAYRDGRSSERAVTAIREVVVGG